MSFSRSTLVASPATPRRVRPQARAAVCAALAAVACALAAGLAPGNAVAGSATGASITVDASQPGVRIDPDLFGSDFLAPFGGMGSFDAASDSFWPSFLEQLRGPVYAGSLRFPGGIAAESYDWQRAIGPQSQRTDNAIGPSNGPSPSTVGPDEFGQLLDRTGATGVATVNFGTGSAQEASDFVQYMTGRPGTSASANQRAQNGHPAPYDVRWWEVGNEEYSTDYWRTGTPVTVNGPPGGCPTVATCLYIYGGSTQFSGQKVVGYADRSAAAAVSDGGDQQSFYVAYPPVQPGSATIDVGGQAWTQVASLSGAGPSSDDYTLNPSTGEITFGDGVLGAIPPSGATITASYISGPHDGFLQFYRAMKQANPAIKVCSTDTSEDFIEAMGSTLPYDCLQEHPYVGAGDASPSEPIETYETQVMGVPDTEAASVGALQSELRQDAGRQVPLVLSEYGQLVSSTPDRTVVPYYLSSLDEALLNASQLADWIRLGIPVADRQLLNAELPPATLTTSSLRHLAPWSAGGAMVDAGTRTVVEPAGQMLELMKPLAGERRLGIAVADDPRLTVAGGHPIGDLSVVAGAGGGDVVIVAINRDPDASVPVQISVSGLHGSGPATMTRLDGPSALSFNEIGEPASVVIRTSRVRVLHGAIPLTLPPHSISRLTIAGL
jgi:alpha-N-arabinofuranosidase